MATAEQFYFAASLTAELRNTMSYEQASWKIEHLIAETEAVLNTKVVNILFLHTGANYYGFHIACASGLNVIARLARHNIDTPELSRVGLLKHRWQAMFETHLYQELQSHDQIPTSRLLYSRAASCPVVSGSGLAADIGGRAIYLFCTQPGITIELEHFSLLHQKILLMRVAQIRAELFNLVLPSSFIEKWVRARALGREPGAPELFPHNIAPTRRFCGAFLRDKIESVLENESCVVRDEDGRLLVGSVALAAKSSLLRLIPRILPAWGDQDLLYRHVLEHGDFDFGNMLVALRTPDSPLITSVYGWDAGCIVPALLSDPALRATVDLVLDPKTGSPLIARLPVGLDLDRRDLFLNWASFYYQALYEAEPRYQAVLQQGKDARYLWSQLRSWNGLDSEDFFGRLGAWAEQKMIELGETEDLEVEPCIDSVEWLLKIRSS